MNRKAFLSSLFLLPFVGKKTEPKKVDTIQFDRDFKIEGSKLVGVINGPAKELAIAGLAATVAMQELLRNLKTK